MFGPFYPGNELVHGLQEPGIASGGKLREDFCHRKDLRLLPVFRPALTGGVKQTHGVDLISKKFASNRPVVSRGEKVQNTAPQSKLARALHLLTAGISRGGKAFGQLRQVMDLPHAQGLCRLGQQCFREGPLEEGIHSGHDQRRPPGGHGPENGEPPVLPLAGDHGGIVEGKLPGGQPKDRLPGQSGQVLPQTGGLGLVGAQKDHRTPGISPDAGGKMGAVDRRQPCDGRGTPAGVDGRQNLGKFRDLG